MPVVQWPSEYFLGRDVTLQLDAKMGNFPYSLLYDVGSLKLIHVGICNQIMCPVILSNMFHFVIKAETLSSSIAFLVTREGNISATEVRVPFQSRDIHFNNPFIVSVPLPKSNGKVSEIVISEFKFCYQSTCIPFFGELKCLQSNSIDTCFRSTA